MKCLILAGGYGERLWPLSRKNYPKQFIQIQTNHSVFQETVARNIPYCDEFIIVTGYEYRFIVENQMKAFRGTPYRCVFEEEPRKTTAAITLSCLGLQPSELVFVVAADHLIDSHTETIDGRNGYKDAILQAKEYARNGAIALFCMQEEIKKTQFGYIIGISECGDVAQFIEKPDRAWTIRMKERKDIYRNQGMLLFQNDMFQHELALLEPKILRQCELAYDRRQQYTSSSVYAASIQRTITPISIERGLLEKCRHLKAVQTGFEWSDLGSLEDLGKTDYHTEGVSITSECSNTIVINNSARQAVVVNDLDNVMVVNTEDAVYVGRHGKSTELKAILRDYPELRTYADKGTKYYRSWGVYEQLIETPNYRIRQIYVFCGKTIYSHKHSHRSENWTIVNGEALVTLNGVGRSCKVKDNIDIPIGMEHQISNTGDEMLIFVETAVGDGLNGRDMVSKQVDDVAELELGYSIEPMVKLLPAFKDYCWGGTKMHDVYGMDCDYPTLAESWLLSAHPAGQSIVAEGKHKGLRFEEYLAVVGKEVLGWKCGSLPLQRFPMLVKFIDANENLSVQVHPDDEYALVYENEYGKNEMWYVIDAEPGAGLYVGFKQTVNKGEVRRHIEDKTILELLNFYPTKPGDVYFIPAGTVHAIGAGNLICEIQQSSNSTYRIYDYGRVDKFGNPRQLHLEKALDVLDYHKYIPQKFKCDENGTLISQCKYFEVHIYDVNGEEKVLIDDSRFYSIVCIKGNGVLKLMNYKMAITAGDSIFIPAISETLKIKGKLSIVISHV